MSKDKGKLICAWCKKFLDWIEGFADTSHGICDDCAKKFFGRTGGQ